MDQRVDWKSQAEKLAEGQPPKVRSIVMTSFMIGWNGRGLKDRRILLDQMKKTDDHLAVGFLSRADDAIAREDVPVNDVREAAKCLV